MSCELLSPSSLVTPFDRLIVCEGQVLFESEFDLHPRTQMFIFRAIQNELDNLSEIVTGLQASIPAN